MVAAQAVPCAMTAATTARKSTLQSRMFPNIAWHYIAQREQMRDEST